MNPRHGFCSQCASQGVLEQLESPGSRLRVAVSRAADANFVPEGVKAGAGSTTARASSGSRSLERPVESTISTEDSRYELAPRSNPCAAMTATWSSRQATAYSRFLVPPLHMKIIRSVLICGPACAARNDSAWDRLRLNGWGPYKSEHASIPAKWWSGKSERARDTPSTRQSD